MIGCTATARRIVRLSGLRQAEVADLAFGDELGHRSDGVLDGHLGVDAVLVVEVDVVHTQPAQGRLAGPVDVLGAAAHRGNAGSRPADDPELGGQHHLVAAFDDGPADQLLVGAGPYMSDVSRKVTPSSIARWIVAMDSGSSSGWPRRSRSCPCSRGPWQRRSGPWDGRGYALVEGHGRPSFRIVQGGSGAQDPP